ncbi:Six-hairpin glycosidase-like protein [Trichoderma sp. SZMC 28011]
MTSNGTDTGSGTSQSKPYSIRMAESVMARGQGLASPDGDSGEWLRIGFFQTALLEILSSNGLDDMVEQRERVLDYLECGTRKAASLVLDAKRNVTFSLDRLSLGRGLSFQYERSKDELYKNALDALRESIDLQPRNHFGGLWYFHYPDLSYLDGMYMLVPFMLDYSGRQGIGEADNAVREILQQMNLLWEHCLHEPSGLFAHGYDSSQKSEWSHNKNGASPFVWGRSLTWLTLALLAALESPTMTKDSAKWEDLKSKFQYLLKKVVHCRDSKSNGWWQLMCSPDLPGNYIESSCSSIFVFVILRGPRLGFLESLLRDDNIEKEACEAYHAVVRKFVVKRGDGTLGFQGTVDVCSLNSPASYDYYLSCSIQQDSVLGTSAFILASLERERYTGVALD